ncbi:hypothetical protein [Paenibacillus aceris]|uniref:DUF4240 domain-containing protein n=1 Tax=Paenibacillus aceris TaxID=869555 RepID=A0ABS4HQM9_9BACL|nr:hypothetical protein [Paenibacillus aceris]MBP1960830.1 hypothetical protein [Paenibacillus aceris]NHW35492.1 hypothetical protein [Paenibacillus aceris]
MWLELNKQTTRKIGIMLKSRLIWYKHYFLFCDEIIENMDRPPYWIIELAEKKYIGDAVKIVNTYAFSEPFETYPDSLPDLYVGCLFIRYERKEISWASFLKESGDYADGEGYFALKHDCEYFYHMLNEYEDNEFSIQLEQKQAEDIKEAFRNEIQEVRIIYNPFVEYFRKYVSLQNSTPN